MLGLRFRDRIQEEFAVRRRKNPRYSLRALARTLRTDHATLSQCLRGRRRVPFERIAEWAGRLGVSGEETAAYLAAEQLPDGETHAQQEQVRHWIAEAAAVIGQPAHYRIVALLSAGDFQPDCRWIAEQIGSTTDEVNLALSRLLRLRLVELTAGAAWSELTGVPQLTESKFRELALGRVRELARKEGIHNAPSGDSISDPVEEPGRNGELLLNAV